MGMAAILVNGPWPILAIFHSPAPRRLHSFGPEVSEEKSFEIITIFSIQMYRAQMHTSKLVKKRSNTNVRPSF